MSKHNDMDVPFERRLSTVHGWGAFAKRALSSGSFLGFYTGDYITLGEMIVRQRAWKSHFGFEHPYLFKVNDQLFIDGGRLNNNGSAFINHSCDPNCTTRVVNDPSDGCLKVAVYATKDINEGSELFYDYWLHAESKADALTRYSCRCGSLACRGTMAGSWFENAAELKQAQADAKAAVAHRQNGGG